MKKTILLLALAAMAASLAAAGRFQVSLAANVTFPADSGYREIYGNSALLPELKAGFFAAGSLYAWAGYGWFSASGETPVLKEPAESRQGFLAAGAGYQRPLAGGWSLFGELGPALIAYREEALGISASGSVLGVLAQAGVRRDLGARFFLLAQAGYAYGRRTIEGVPVKLGGARAGVGAGVRF